jgi:hypothetical protein
VVYPEDPRDIAEMVQLLRDEIMVGFPDTQVFVQRGSLLNVDGGNSRVRSGSTSRARISAR